MRPTCQVTGCFNLAKIGNKGKDGNQLYKKFCNKHNSESYDSKDSKDKQLAKARDLRNKYDKSSACRHFKKSFCEVCGFVAKNKCQLDVDHIDGNHENNEPSNLQTLCANCHRLKTWNNKDWIR